MIGAAVVLFIASFLDYYSYSTGGYSTSQTAWDSLGIGIGTYIGGVIGAALIIVNRALPQPRKVAGLDLGTVGTAFTVLVAWILFWSLVDVPDGIDAGAGLILGFVLALVLAAAAIATDLVPALKAPLMGAPRSAAPQPYGGQPQGGYGYPGQQQPYGGQPQAGQPGQPGQPAQPYGGQPQAQSFGGGQPQAPQPAQPAAGFSPFWFAVPEPRQLFPEDGSQTPVAELTPGVWYLALEQRGSGLLTEVQGSSVRGVLRDAANIQRGD